MERKKCEETNEWREGGKKRDERRERVEKEI